MEKTLELVFKNEQGGKKVISISGYKEGLTKDEAEAAMQAVVAADVFETGGGALVEAVEARVVTRGVEKLA